MLFFARSNHQEYHIIHSRCHSITLYCWDKYISVIIIAKLSFNARILCQYNNVLAPVFSIISYISSPWPVVSMPDLLLIQTLFNQDLLYTCCARIISRHPTALYPQPKPRAQTRCTLSHTYYTAITSEILLRPSPPTVCILHCHIIWTEGLLIASFAQGTIGLMRMLIFLLQ